MNYLQRRIEYAKETTETTFCEDILKIVDKSSIFIRMYTIDTIV